MIGSSCDYMKNPFLFIQSSPEVFHKLSRQMQENQTTLNLLSETFFGQNNIDLIQQKLINEVYKKTNGQYLISKQNENDLKSIMQSILFQYPQSKNLSIKTQIQQLNNLVVGSAIKDVMSELICYDSYINQLFGPAKIMDYPKATSNKRVLPSSFRV